MWNRLPYNTTKLTLELRDIVDNKEHPINIWDFDYPSFYEGEAKAEFERKVIDHFYFRQIGQETVGRFLHCFRSKIREIMPYYIQMYKSVETMNAIDDPFGNVDIVETFEQETEDNSTGTTTSTGSSSTTEESNREHRFSSTPQGSIDNLDNYMTEASKDNDDISNNVSSEASGSSNSQASGTVKHTLTRKGNQGVNTYAHDMIELRQSFINVDMMIINELNPLFLGVY